MTASSELQSKYVDLYRFLRGYIWDFETVEKIAELEISIYKLFPDMKEVKASMTELLRKIRSTDAYKNDEELKESFETLKEFAENIEDLYLDIQTFNEVIEHDHQEESDEEEPSESESDDEEPEAYSEEDESED